MVPAPLSLVAQAASPNLAFGETYRAVKHKASGRTGGRCWPGVGVPRRPARSRAPHGDHRRGFVLPATLACGVLDRWRAQKRGHATTDVELGNSSQDADHLSFPRASLVRCRRRRDRADWAEPAPVATDAYTVVDDRSENTARRAVPLTSPSAGSGEPARASRCWRRRGGARRRRRTRALPADQARHRVRRPDP